MDNPNPNTRSLLITDIDQVDATLAGAYIRLAGVHLCEVEARLRLEYLHLYAAGRELGRNVYRVG